MSGVDRGDEAIDPCRASIERAGQRGRLIWATADEQLAKSISDILWEVWDPIEMNRNPGAAGEYDSYAAEILELLRTGALEDTLVQHLANLELDAMGVAHGKTTRASAKALLKSNL